METVYFYKIFVTGYQWYSIIFHATIISGTELGLAE